MITRIASMSVMCVSLFANTTTAMAADHVVAFGAKVGSQVDQAGPSQTDAVPDDSQTKATPPDSADLSKGESDPLSNLPTYGEALIRMVVVLVSILIALLILAKLLPRWLNRSFGQRGKGDITIVDSIQLEPRRRVYLLRVGERNVLVGSSEQGLHTLVNELSNADGASGTDHDGGLDAAIIPPGHQPSSLATPFESVMKSKDGATSNLRENV